MVRHTLRTCYAILVELIVSHTCFRRALSSVVIDKRHNNNSSEDSTALKLGDTASTAVVYRPILVSYI